MLLFLATRNRKRWRFYSLVTRLLRDQIQYGEQCAIIDIYLSGLLAVILVDWKHAWQIEADEYESDC